jgi:hypothetical protein
MFRLTGTIVWLLSNVIRIYLYGVSSVGFIPHTRRL